VELFRDFVGEGLSTEDKNETYAKYKQDNEQVITTLTCCGRTLRGIDRKVTKVMMRSPTRSKNLSRSTVVTEYAKESPVLLERTYPRAISPILAGNTLLIKSPEKRAMKVSRKRVPLPVIFDHLYALMVQQRNMQGIDRKRNRMSAALRVVYISRYCTPLKAK
jgi:hypothetical protein